MVADPCPVTVTSPEADTVATSVKEDDQVTAAPTISFPSSSMTRAVNWMVNPTTLELAIEGVTSTLDGTGGSAQLQSTVRAKRQNTVEARVMTSPRAFPAEMAGFSGLPAILAGFRLR